ncbi:MAG: hypothetical protein OEZ58_04190 [Gammaproteobacteria bacterium]|nr:hypothetical protein [Gammaproteobacteria bacterium]MDH5728163.1 hypothetical protein [Gammaproteobacteria bacterium]
MRKLLILVSGVVFAGSVIAGSMDSEGNPHGKSGGCESKAKIAELKSIHGDDWLKKIQKHAIIKKADEARSTKPSPTSKSWENFI